MKKEFVKLAGILCLITLVAAFLLAGVNKITAPKIVQAEKEAAEIAMKSVLPDAQEFIELCEGVNAGFKGEDVVGYCVDTAANGYGGEITMIVGITAEGTVSGIEILSHSETAGLGAKAVEPEFKEQFKGKNSPIEVVKGSSGGESEIAAITGATVTSRAVAGAVDEAYNKLLKAFEELKK